MGAQLKVWLSEFGRTLLPNSYLSNQTPLLDQVNLRKDHYRKRKGAAAAAERPLSSSSRAEADGAPPPGSAAAAATGGLAPPPPSRPPSPARNQPPRGSSFQTAGGVLLRPARRPPPPASRPREGVKTLRADLAAGTGRPSGEPSAPPMPGPGPRNRKSPSARRGGLTLAVRHAPARCPFTSRVHLPEARGGLKASP
ncbi:hypothetical protein FQA47_017268 [Oryzias melastigma]|uniref:Uncharacterized protein n=1 Tax=Oryzias melastigma TaxID=30732 RepID=A0A834FLB9_ORYME|nr:hypothetical protein FQA47_017268 [Oryzias melastigma]